MTQPLLNRAQIDTCPQTPRRKEGKSVLCETQGEPPCYSFSTGDTFYDSPAAYSLSWREVLPQISIAVTVTAATPDEPLGAGKKVGSLRVQFYQPNAERSQLVIAGERFMTQDDFVEFLRIGQLHEGG